MTAPEAPTIGPPHRPPGKRSVGKIIAVVAAAVVAVVVALIVGIVLLVDNSTGDAQRVSDQFVAALQRGDGAAAYKLTGPSLRAEADESKISELAHTMATLVGKQKRSPSAKAISANSERGQVAVFMYTMRAYADMELFWKVQVRDEDGAWKVMAFRTATEPLGTDVE